MISSFIYNQVVTMTDVLNTMYDISKNEKRGNNIVILKQSPNFDEKYNNNNLTLSSVYDNY